jgi:hypothetical protein
MRAQGLRLSSEDADDGPVRVRGKRLAPAHSPAVEHKILARCLSARRPASVSRNGRGAAPASRGVGSHHGTSQTRTPLLARPAEPGATFTGTERGGAQHIPHERGGWQ